MGEWSFGFVRWFNWLLGIFVFIFEHFWRMMEIIFIVRVNKCKLYTLINIRFIKIHFPRVSQHQTTQTDVHHYKYNEPVIHIWFIPRIDNPFIPRIYSKILANLYSIKKKNRLSTRTKAIKKPTALDMENSCGSSFIAISKDNGRTAGANRSSSSRLRETFFDAGVVRNSVYRLYPHVSNIRLYGIIELTLSEER